jgi:hypothetical protein
MVSTRRQPQVSMASANARRPRLKPRRGREQGRRGDGLALLDRSTAAGIRQRTGATSRLVRSRSISEPGWLDGSHDLSAIIV